MKHKLFLFLAAIGIFLPLAADAETFEVDGITYRTTDETSVSVTSNGYSGDIVIPAIVNYGGATYNVTSIGRRAFWGRSGLTSVTIPNSVTSIGDEAFKDSRGLTSVTIGNGVTSIGYQAFMMCSGLTSITIPNSVTSIGSDAFSDCTGLTSITFPNSVTSIGMGAFSRCTGLTSVTIPGSVTSIGSRAFNGCSSLTSITIPNSVTSIGNGAFRSCSGLTSINVQEGNAEYDSRGNCNAIIETASNALIAGCKNTVIPNSVTSIGEDAFFDCTGLTSVTIPSSVTSIGEYAFYNCTGLTSITIPNSVKSIASSAFSGVYVTESSFINKSTMDAASNNYWGATICDYRGEDGLCVKNNVVVKYLGNGSNVIIPEGVTSINSSVFKGCTNLVSVSIPSSVTSIGSSAFSGCNAIKEVYAKPLVPPTYGDKTFDDNVCTTATLYVPNTNNCFTRYSGKEGWNNFRNIVEYDMSLLDEDPDGKPCATPTIAYKDGKLVFNSTTSGAEYHSNITAQDAGTGITSGSELKLAATYDISVYATAEGCARSASAYATLVFNLDGSGTEEEGIISVMASPVLINAEGGTLYVSGLTNATEVEYFTLEGRALGRSMVTDGCTMFTTDQPKGSTLIVTVNGRGAKVVVR